MIKHQEFGDEKLSRFEYIAGISLEIGYTCLATRYCNCGICCERNSRIIIKEQRGGTGSGKENYILDRMHRLVGATKFLTYRLHRNW